MVNVMGKGQYVVAGYQGRLSVRFVPHNSTTVYSDSEVASFDTIEEANAYADEHEPAYSAAYDEWYHAQYDENESQYGY